MGRLASLESTIGLSFSRRSLLELAFVHSSYLNEHPGAFPESNERLEFLGDAHIGLVMAHELYHRFPDRPEGELTAMRSALVQGKTLAGVSRSLGLGEYLLLGSGEEATGGRERPTNLAATLEALVGAVLLDQGYEPSSAFVLRALAGQLSEIADRQVPKNSKSVLQEQVQGEGRPSPSYRIVEVAGQDHAREFTAEVLVGETVMGRGTGRRKSLAEEQAARDALAALGYAG